MNPEVIEILERHVHGEIGTDEEQRQIEALLLSISPDLEHDALSVMLSLNAILTLIDGDQVRESLTEYDSIRLGPDIRSRPHYA